MITNYLKDWQEFLNEHESISLLEISEDGWYHPINNTVFILYDGFVLERIKVIDNLYDTGASEVLVSIRHYQTINIIHVDPYNNITFAKLID